MNLEWCRTLYAHMEWGDALIWQRVLAHEGCSEDPFIRESLLHLHFVQHAYLAGWTKGAFEQVTLDDFPNLEALQKWGREYYAKVGEYLKALAEADLDTVGPVLWADIIEQRIGKPPTPASHRDMMYQVVSHSGHHRAQINRRIREVGGEPAFIDYISWAWLARPQADWS